MSSSARQSDDGAPKNSDLPCPPPNALPSRVDLEKWGPAKVFELVQKHIKHQLAEPQARKFQAEDIDGGTLLKFGGEFKFWRENGFSVGAANNISEFVRLFDGALPPPALSSSSSASTVSNPEEAYEEKTRKLGEKMKELAEKEKWTLEALADPKTVFHLPFPAVGCAKNRFKLVNGMFQFVGREKIKLLYKLLMGEEESETPMNAVCCYGTEGYGRSYIIAALVVLLMVAGKRVVYVPDCTDLLSGSVRELRRSLYMAFHDKPKISAKIRGFFTPEAIERFCAGYGGSMIFVFDKYDALQDPPDSQRDGRSANSRETVRDVLNRISGTSRRLFASAASDQVWRLQQTLQQNKHWVELRGGFSKEAYNTWWSLQKNIPASVDQKGLENVTGRVPLFLSDAIAALPKWTIGINKIYDKSLAFSKEIEKRMLKKEQWRVKLHYEHLEEVVLFKDAREPDLQILDHRYFYYEDGKIHTIAPFLLKAAQRAIISRDCHILSMVDYCKLIEKMEGNTSTIGFAAEGAAIASIRVHGLLVIDKRFNGPVTQRSFRGVTPAFETDLQTPGFYMYVPEMFNYPAIDMLLVKTNGTKKKPPTSAVLLPIQVTLNHAGHSNSEKHFFEKIDVWVKEFVSRGIEITTIFFVWITPGGNVRKKVEKDQLGFEHPAYTRVVVSFGDVHERIQEALLNVGIDPTKKATIRTASEDSPELESPTGTPEPEDSEEDDATGGTTTRTGRNSRKRSVSSSATAGASKSTAKKSQTGQSKSGCQSTSTTGSRRTTRDV